MRKTSNPPEVSWKRLGAVILCGGLAVIFTLCLLDTIFQHFLYNLPSLLLFKILSIFHAFCCMLLVVVVPLFCDVIIAIWGPWAIFDLIRQIAERDADSRRLWRKVHLEARDKFCDCMFCRHRDDCVLSSTEKLNWASTQCELEIGVSLYALQRAARTSLGTQRPKKACKSVPSVKVPAKDVTIVEPEKVTP